MHRISTYAHRRLSITLVLYLCSGLWGCAAAQGVPEKAEQSRSKARGALRFDYIGYRPAAALAVEPDGIKRVPFEIKGKRVELALGDLHVCRLVVLPNHANAEQAYNELCDRVLEDERRGF